ncbi:MAG: ABC transporter ATP-binding protein [Hyphomicrobiaceae bacterium]|nr:ABC transporter ATP-binding protein [Hyphomicrobiaceae bacterium]
MSNDDVVVVDRLVKRYGKVTALNGVSLDVQRGEFIALLGPSGCGKTTLLRAVAGFVEPTSGEIRINGRSMTVVPPNLRPVNTVFQQYALFPHMSVVDNVAFGPRRQRLPAREVEKRVSEALDMVGLASLGARFPRELSGGQQQRVALARALVNQPEVLLLDEPLGALDLKLRKRMQVELKRLHQQLGMTFLFVTHDQEEALAIADRIGVMRDGDIVQLGSGAEIYRNPATRYVADFIGEANLLDCCSDSDGSVRLAPDGPLLPYRAAAGGLRDVSLMIRPEDMQVGATARGEDCVALSATLNDKVFIGATWRLYFVIANGQEIAAEPGYNPAAERLQPGEMTTVHWRRDAARLLQT